MATKVWSGNSGTDALWSRVNNWVGGVIPTTGDDVEFDSYSIEQIPDLDYNVSLNSITFISGGDVSNLISTSNYTITLTGDVTNDSSNEVNIDVDISLSSGVRTFDCVGRIDLEAVVSGAGSITKTGSNQLRLEGNNTFSGGIQVDAGELRGHHNNSFGSSKLTMNSSGTTLKLSGTLTIPNNVDVDAYAVIKNVNAGACIM